MQAAAVVVMVVVVCVFVCVCVCVVGGRPEMYNWRLWLNKKAEEPDHIGKDVWPRNHHLRKLLCYGSQIVDQEEFHLITQPH